MLVQYLVGLCCLRWDPDAVDVTIGDMVLDTAAGKVRDVDVTVTVSESGSITHAFKAYEVKREAAPLDVAEVEQLCLKLIDMPSVTHRAIVSSSGFTEGARTKADRHGVALYQLRPWVRPLQEQFPLLTMQGTIEECFPTLMSLLCWVQPQISLVARTAGGPFSVLADDPLLDGNGATHPNYPTFDKYRQELLLRSTEILFTLEPAVTVHRTFPIPFTASENVAPAGPAWPHTHTLDVAADNVFVRTDKGDHQLNVVTITGFLQWQRSTERPQHYIIEGIPDGEAFAGALIALEPRDGRMTALVFSPKTREIGIHFVRLAEKHRNAIRELKLELPGAM